MKNTKENKLVDINNIYIDMNKPIEQRQKQFIDEIKNPYKFACNGLTVEVEFIGNSSITDKVINYVKKHK